MSGPASQPSSAAEVPVRHGYTVADLDTVTRKAGWGSRWRFLGYPERVSVARFAIVEHLLIAVDRPDFWHLVNVGERAIRQHVEAEEHWGGFWVTRSDVDLGTPMVRFHRYWHASAAPTRSPENQVVDVLALRQIWPKLTRMQRAALLALAEHGDYDTAAAELDISYRTLVSHLHGARNEFLRWRHQHETASKPGAATDANLTRRPGRTTTP